VTSIWVTNTKFYRNLSFCLRDFYSLFKVISWICVCNMTYFSYWLTSSVTSFLVDKQTKWCQEAQCLIKILRTEKGYGAKRLISEFPRRNWSLVSVKCLLHKIDNICIWKSLVFDSAILNLICLQRQRWFLWNSNVVLRINVVSSV